MFKTPIKQLKNSDGWSIGRSFSSTSKTKVELIQYTMQYDIFLKINDGMTLYQLYDTLCYTKKRLDYQTEKQNEM